jgi:hypothetical protein
MTEPANDDLRARLSRIDPAATAGPVDPATSPRVAELVERAMRMTDVLPVVDLPGRRRSRRSAVWAAAVAAVAAAVVGVVVAVGGGGAPMGHRPTTVALSLPSSDERTRCLPFDVAVLRTMPLAFAGTVTTANRDAVSLDVDHWYRGGDADRVTVAVPDGQSSAALDVVDFRSGQRYLVTATDGTVSGCGYSGPATPQLEDAFAAAFGS